MDMQQFGSVAGMVGGLIVLGVLAPIMAKHRPPAWPVIALGIAQIIGPCAPLLHDRISESTQIAISLTSLTLSVVGLGGIVRIWMRPKA